MNKDLVLAVLAALTAGAFASGNLETAYRTSGAEVHKAFEEVKPYLQTGSAVFSRGRDEVIFGVVVSPEGHILTKASELGDVSEMSVTVGTAHYDAPRVLVEDPAWDVALVKVSATDLKPVDLSSRGDLERGEWLVANGATTRRDRRVQVGIVAANTREVKSKGGTVLGVSLDVTDGLVIKEVTEGGGADRAGLKPGDRLLSVAGAEVKAMEDLLELLENRHVGEKVAVKFERDGAVMETPVELAGRVDLFGEETTRNDAMSGEFSERRTGFPRVMQHDIMGNRRFMGGPVFDLEGHCVGMNIARFSRCETYAIPAEDLRSLVAKLMGEAANAE